MKNNILFAGILCALLSLCPPLRAQRNEMPPRVTGAHALEAATRLDYLLEDQTAIRLLPSTMVIGQGVTRAEWSPDGRFVLAVRIPPVLEPTFAVPVSITVWDKTTGRSSELWSRRLAGPELAGQTEWLAQAKVGLLHLRWMEADENNNWFIREGFVWINTAQSSAHEVDSQSGDSLYLAPAQTGGILLHDSSKGLIRSLNVIGADGSVSPDVPVPAGTWRCSQMRWLADGKQFCIELSIAVTDQDGEQNGKNGKQNEKETLKPQDQNFDGAVKKQWFALSMSDRKMPRLSLLEQDPGGMPALPGNGKSSGLLPGAGKSVLHVKSVLTALKQGDVETEIHSLWLATEGAKPMSALLCADGEQAQIAPGGDAVLYLAQNGVWVTMLQHTPRPLFLASVLAPHQEEVRYRAWTLAQAVRMWSEAHKGVLPAPNEARAALQSLMPYEPLYAGFRYVWSGGALPASAHLIQPLIAEIVGAGGRAQVFADGHIAWKDNE